MHASSLQPLHMNITAGDLQGNGRLGRYILLPGSDGRASAMAQRLQNMQKIEHPRQHNFYKGSFRTGSKQTIDVGIMSSGMGCPSMDIIASELLHLGAKRLVRIGTAGSLQPQRIRVGDLVAPLAAVRDEGTSRHYLDPSIPVGPSLEFLDAVRRASRSMGQPVRLFIGPTHTKDSLYAREFGQGPLQPQHQVYMKHLRDAGVLASEMECAQLFTLVQVWNQKLIEEKDPGADVRCGAVLAIIGDDEPFADGSAVAKTVEDAIDLVFACLGEWAGEEDKKWI